MAGPVVILTGVDGEEWAFGDPYCPVRLKYVKGLGGADFTVEDTEGVGQAGVTFIARNDKPNAVTLGANLGPVPKAQGMDLLQRWRRTLGRATALTVGGPLIKLEVVQSGRYQWMRRISALPSPYEQMANVGWMFEDVDLRSDETWWRTDPVVKEFTAAEFSGATVTSFSTEPVWPHYRLTGPIISPKLSLAGEGVVSLPTLTTGQWLDIEADPDWWDIRDQAGAERSWIGDRWYVQAPAATNPETGVEVPITITHSGGTSVDTKLKVTLPQLFETAL